MTKDISVFLQISRQQPIKLQIDPTMSGTKLIEILKKETEIGSGIYQFVLHGKILFEPQPFANLKNNDKIILHIMPKPKHRNNEAVINDLIERLQRGPDLAEEEEQNQILNEVYMRSVDVLDIETLYENHDEIWFSTNSAMLQDLTNAMRDNPAVYNALLTLISPHNVSLPLLAGNTMATPALLAGYRHRVAYNVANTSEAIQQTLNPREREHFQALVEQGIDPMRLCQELERHNMNFEAAEESLQNSP